MKNVTLRRQELKSYEECFRSAGMVTRGEHEDRDSFMRFRYAVGRNWHMVESALNRANARYRQMILPGEGYQKFLCEREKIARKHALKDEKGQPVSKQVEGQDIYQFDETGARAGEAELDALKKQMEDVCREQEMKIAAGREFLAGVVHLQFYSVPWEWVPERIAAPFLDMIAAMCDGVPEPGAAAADGMAPRLRIIGDNTGTQSAPK
jgi:hypothetical protein